MHHKTYSGLSSAGEPDYQAFIPPNPPFWSSTPLNVGQYVPVYHMQRNVKSFASTTGENVIAQNMSHLTQDMLDLYGYDSVPLHGIAAGPTSPPYIPNSLPLFSSTSFNIADYQPVWKASPMSPDDIIKKVSPLPPIRALTGGSSGGSRFFGDLADYDDFAGKAERKARRGKRKEKRSDKKVHRKEKKSARKEKRSDRKAARKGTKGVSTAEIQAKMLEEVAKRTGGTPEKLIKPLATAMVADREFPDKWNEYAPPMETPIETVFEEDYSTVAYDTEEEEKGFPVVPVVIGLAVSAALITGLFVALK